MRLPRKANIVRRNTELNACEIWASYNAPTYRKLQKPIHIYAYIYYFNYKIIRKTV